MQALRGQPRRAYRSEFVRRPFDRAVAATHAQSWRIASIGGRQPLVDDHPIVRSGIVSVLATQPDFEVERLGVENRTSAVRVAIERGLVGER